jgi:membrane protease subunit HflC
MRTGWWTILAVLLFIVAIIVSQSLFIVDERDQAILLQLGRPVAELKTPGLKDKVP